jgi:hypothetical protein
MSLRYLYRVKSPAELVCQGCGRVVQRNIAVFNDEMWHYGCLNEAKRFKYRCAGCGADLRTLDTISVTLIGETVKSCRFCGGVRLDPLYPHGYPPFEIPGSVATE